MAPCLFLMPIGSFLTVRAMNDAPMFSNDSLSRLWLKLKRRKQKQEAQA